MTINFETTYDIGIYMIPSQTMLHGWCSFDVTRKVTGAARPLVTGIGLEFTANLDFTNTRVSKSYMFGIKKHLEKNYNGRPPVTLRSSYSLIESLVEKVPFRVIHGLGSHNYVSLQNAELRAEQTQAIRDMKNIFPKFVNRYAKTAIKHTIPKYTRNYEWSKQLEKVALDMPHWLVKKALEDRVILEISRKVTFSEIRLLEQDITGCVISIPMGGKVK